jgi:hypothetical protein
VRRKKNATRMRIRLTPSLYLRQAVLFPLLPLILILVSSFLLMIKDNPLNPRHMLQVGRAFQPSGSPTLGDFEFSSQTELGLLFFVVTIPAGRQAT